jgi:hypothetical protein
MARNLIFDTLIFTSAASSVTLMLDRTFLHMASTSGGQIPPNKKTLQAIRSAKAEPAADVVSCRGEPLPRPSQIETRSMPLQQGSNSWRRTTGSDCHKRSGFMKWRAGPFRPGAAFFCRNPITAKVRRAALETSSTGQVPLQIPNDLCVSSSGWRTPRASRKNTPREDRAPNRNQPDFHRKAVRSRRFLLTMRLISYIMLTKKSGCFRAPSRLLRGALQTLPLSYFLSALFPDFCWASS